MQSFWGQKWFKTEWKPSMQIVWESGDAWSWLEQHIPFHKLVSLQ